MEEAHQLSPPRRSFILYFFSLLTLLLTAILIGKIKNIPQLSLIYRDIFLLFIFIHGVLYFIFKKKKSFPLFVFYFCFFIHLIFVFRYDDKVEDFHKSFSETGKRFTITATLEEIYGSKDDKIRFFVELLEIRGEKSLLLTQHNFANIYFQGQLTKDLKIGQVLKLENVYVSWTKRNSEENASDYDSYLRSQDIIASIFINHEKQIIIEKEANLKNPFILLMIFKNELKEKLEHLLPNDVYGFSKALILGDRTQVDPSLNRYFQNAGVTHFISISGVHIAILSFFLFTFLRPLFKTKISRRLITFIFLPLYTLILWFSPPILRTFLMLVIALFLSYLGRSPAKNPPLFFALFFSAFILHLLISPNDVFSISFQLSFTATLGLFFGLYLMEKYKPIHRKLLFFLLEFCILSFAAQLFTEGLVIYYFNIFSPMSLFYNLLFHPFIFAYLFLTFLIILLPHFLAVYCAKILVFLYQFMMAFFHITSAYTPFYDVELDLVNLLLLSAAIFIFIIIALKKTHEISSFSEK